MNKSLANLIHTPFIWGAAGAVRDRFQMSLLKFYREPAAVDIIQQAYREADLQMCPFDAYSLYTLVSMQTKIAGSMAEIGMYRGASAKIICSLKGQAKFYGFDTFEGLPEGNRADEKWFHKADYRSNQTAVAAYLKDFPGVTLTKGLFPASGRVLSEERLSFVNLDVDLYKSTIDALDFLWDKLSPRGLVLIHDTHCEGVKNAIREFLAGHDALSFGCGCSQVALTRP